MSYRENVINEIIRSKTVDCYKTTNVIVAEDQVLSQREDDEKIYVIYVSTKMNGLHLLVPLVKINVATFSERFKGRKQKK